MPLLLALALGLIIVLLIGEIELIELLLLILGGVLLAIALTADDVVVTAACAEKVLIGGLLGGEGGCEGLNRRAGLGGGQLLLRFVHLLDGFGKALGGAIVGSLTRGGVGVVIHFVLRIGDGLDIRGDGIAGLISGFAADQIPGGGDDLFFRLCDRLGALLIVILLAVLLLLLLAVALLARLLVFALGGLLALPVNHLERADVGEEHIAGGAAGFAVGAGVLGPDDIGEVS